MRYFHTHRNLFWVGFYGVGYYKMRNFVPDMTGPGIGVYRFIMAAILLLGVVYSLSTWCAENLLPAHYRQACFLAWYVMNGLLVVALLCSIARPGNHVLLAALLGVHLVIFTLACVCHLLVIGIEDKDWREGLRVLFSYLCHSVDAGVAWSDILRGRPPFALRELEPGIHNSFEPGDIEETVLRLIAETEEKYPDVPSSYERVFTRADLTRELLQNVEPDGRTKDHSDR